MRAPTSQCAYLNGYFGKPLLPSLVPSISSECVAAYNTGSQSAYCVSNCQSLYSTSSSTSYANSGASNLCGKFGSSFCTDFMDSSLVYAVQTYCKDVSYCSPSCKTSINNLELFSGCCKAGILNGPKVLCGQQPIAPCSTILNSGSVAASSSECAYFNWLYGGGSGSSQMVSSLLPSLNATPYVLLL